MSQRLSDHEFRRRQSELIQAGEGSQKGPRAISEVAALSDIALSLREIRAQLKVMAMNMPSPIEGVEHDGVLLRSHRTHDKEGPWPHAVPTRRALRVRDYGRKGGRGRGVTDRTIAEVALSLAAHAVAVFVEPKRVAA